MKMPYRLFLITLIIVVPLGACTTKQIPSPESVPESPTSPVTQPVQPQPEETIVPQPVSPSPESQATTEPAHEQEEKLTQESTEQEQLPEIMNWLKVDVRDAYNAISELTLGLSSGATAGKLFLLHDLNGTPVHYINTGDTGLNASIPVDATNFVKLMESVENAYYLVEYNRLRDETKPRDITEKEILAEVEQAYKSLKLQIDYSATAMRDSIEWVENYDNPPMTSTSYIDKVHRIRRINESFDRYNKPLSDILPKLEHILSYGEPYLKTNG